MTDITTNRPLQVSTDGTAGPYLMVPLDQLKAVRTILNDHQIVHWADEGAFSLDNEPYIAVVNFGRSGDAKQIQAILDGIAE